MEKQNLHIVFHNPNTEEETAKFIAKLIARNLAERMLLSRNGEQRMASYGSAELDIALDFN